MGLWNDIGFSDLEKTEDYRRVSDRLYQAVIDAIRDATKEFVLCH